MKQQKYRFNRKEGRIYLDRDGKLTDAGGMLKTIILWAGPPVFGKPFKDVPAQYWVQLTFLNEDEDWCYAVLGSGTTNALAPWLAYRRSVESRMPLHEVVTAIGFEEAEGEHQYFDYDFAGYSSKPEAVDRVRSIIEESPFSIVENLGFSYAPKSHLTSLR